MSTLYLTMRLESEELDTSQLQIFEIAGKEAIGRLFSFDVHVVHADKGGFDDVELIGATATLVFEIRAPTKGIPPESHRVHGMIDEVEDMLDPVADHRTYRLRLVPRAHRLTLVQTQAVYLDQSVPEIIRGKLARVGLDDEDVDFRLLGAYPKREFIVQYKETDFAFVSRLCEHLGISFSFEHDSGRDVIVFSDDNSRFRFVEGGERAAFHPRGEAQSVHRLTAVSRMIPSTFIVQDYNYRAPRLDLTGSHDLPDGYAGGVLEYGAHHLTPAEGEAFARTRAEERMSTRRVLHGASDLFRFHAGARFTLDEHPKIEAAELVLLEVEHAARQVVHTHGGADEPPVYQNTFRALDARVPYRPPRATPKPIIAGVLSARVEPRSDDEIGRYAQIDEQGRYTVRFFFDPSPLGARPLSSLPVRMAQPHAGPNYGFHFPLKPGIEVLVAFHEGDPDRPFIVGSVPNPITPSPVDRQNLLFNRIETTSGVFLEIKDI